MSGGSIFKLVEKINEGGNMIYSRDKLFVRKLEQKDAALLAKWLSDPTVLQYYEGRDRPHNIKMIEQRFFDQNDDEMRCLIIYDGIEIGYIQFYPLDEEGKSSYDCEDDKGRIFGMDQFIGEADYWNRGIGKLLVATTVEYLTSELGAEKIVMDPQTWNIRAITCYEKCGFKKIKLLPKHEWHEGEMRDCWLMEFWVEKV